MLLPRGFRIRGGFGGARRGLLPVGEVFLQRRDLGIGLVLRGQLVLVLAFQIGDRLFRRLGDAGLFSRELAGLLGGEVGGFLLVLEFLALGEHFLRAFFHRAHRLGFLLDGFLRFGHGGFGGLLLLRHFVAGFLRGERGLLRLFEGGGFFDDGFFLLARRRGCRCGRGHGSRGRSSHRRSSGEEQRGLDGRGRDHGLSRRRGLGSFLGRTGRGQRGCFEAVVHGAEFRALGRLAGGESGGSFGTLGALALAAEIVTRRANDDQPRGHGKTQRRKAGALRSEVGINIGRKFALALTHHRGSQLGGRRRRFAPGLGGRGCNTASSFHHHRGGHDCRQGFHRHEFFRRDRGRDRGFFFHPGRVQPPRNFRGALRTSLRLFFQTGRDRPDPRRRHRRSVRAAQCGHRRCRRIANLPRHIVAHERQPARQRLKHQRADGIDIIQPRRRRAVELLRAARGEPRIRLRGNP